MELKRNMNAYANMELRMPARYTDMSETEMEYDGGWWAISAAIIGAGLLTTAIGHATGNNDVKNFGTIIGVIGIASTGIGAYGLATSATAGAVEGAELIAGITSDTLTVCSWVAGV